MNKCNHTATLVEVLLSDNEGQSRQQQLLCTLHAIVAVMHHHAILHHGVIDVDHETMTIRLPIHPEDYLAWDELLEHKPIAKEPL